MGIRHDNDDAYDNAMDCPGCAGGDLWPFNMPYWLCPKCGREYWHDDEGGDE